MVETDEKSVTFSRTLKDGEKLVVNGMEIQIARKKRHDRQIRVTVTYTPEQPCGIDTAETAT